jgi:hypothetical protein
MKKLTTILAKGLAIAFIGLFALVVFGVLGIILIKFTQQW